jgi:glycosyltransferase involved in cell wall biosynthesis
LKKTYSRPLVLIDASDIHQPSGGRTAVLELFREVFQLKSNFRFVIFLSRREADFEGFNSVRQVVIPFRNRILERTFIQLAIFFFVFWRRAHLVHFARTIGGLAWPARSVLTIFDLTTLRYPDLHDAGAVWFWKHLQPWFIRRADKIVSISRYVADELQHFYNLSREAIEVIHCAPKSIFRHPERWSPKDALKIKYGLPDEYLLFIGILAQKKNLHTLLKALWILKKQDREFPPLVLAGRKYRQSEDRDLFRQIEEMNLASHIRYVGPVLDEELPHLYGGAKAFLFPSLDEGFGIPCLEAMTCRTPVIAARRGAIPEITGDAALLLEDPQNAGELADVLHDLLNNPPLRESLILKGTIRSSEFSWIRQADRLLLLYGELTE